MAEKKYIECETAKEFLKRAIFGADKKIDKWMDAVPAADVRPVEWIRVEDQLPEEGERVLCLTRTKKGLCNHVIGYWSEGFWRVGMNSNVTHWMPLPEPPEVPE